MILEMNLAKKLKTSHCPRKFTKTWEKEYFVIEKGNKAMCIVENCRKSLGLYTSTIQYHLLHKHKELSEILGKLKGKDLADFRNEKFQEFSINLTESADDKIIYNIDRHKLASYKVAHNIAKNSKCFSEGEFLKTCMLDVCKTLFPGEIEKHQEFEKVCLSRTTITNRIIAISNSFENNLKLACSNLKFFSICLDESNDKTDLKHLVIYIRGVFDNFEVLEEFLDLVNLTKNSTGIEIFKQVDLIFQKFNLDYRKLISITCDGARNLQGIIKGLIALIKMHMKNILHIDNELVNFHCILHQENLCAKKIELEQVLEKVFETVNLLKKSGNFHKDFKFFLEDEDADFSDILYYTEVRWLSRANCLKRFFDLIENIDKFLISKNKRNSEFSNPIWIFKLAFLVDLTSKLNDLNTSMQGKNSFILNSVELVQTFISDLTTMVEEIENGDFFHFSNSENILEKFSLEKSLIDNELFSNCLKDLLANFKKRFSDFKNIFFDLFSKPFSLKRIEMSNDFQAEVKELNKLNFKIKFDLCSSNEAKMIFFKELPDIFHHFKTNALKISTMFASSYLCEKFFSMLKFRKNQYSSIISTERLQCCLRIACSKSEPNYVDFMNV